MFSRTQYFLRSTATPRGLRSHLRRLRAVSHAAQRELRERRQQEEKEKNTNKIFSSSSSSNSSSSSTYEGVRLDWLPRNDALESAIALAISENRDARTELEFTRHFLQGSFLSLASPVGAWDPYDTKPQVFALDKYIALPVFTSLAYLRLFCKRFRFTVRDPSGVLWADGPAEAAEEEKKDGAHRCYINSNNTPPLPDVSKSEWWERYVKQHEHLSTTPLITAKAPAYEQEVYTQENGGVGSGNSNSSSSSNSSGNNQTSWLSADDLFKEVEFTPQENSDTANKEKNRTCKTKKIVKRTKRFKKGSTRKLKYKIRNKNNKIIGINNSSNNSGSGNREISKRKIRKRDDDDATNKKEEIPPNENGTDNHSALHKAFWTKVSTTAPFCITQATPLPVFGPLLRPFFVGYFADIDTLLHNASIVPDKVDIVLNPCSPIEFVLAREATNRVLHKDQLLLLAYRRVEKELRGEFHRFLHYFAPEVAWARSSCVPCPVPGKPEEVKYELVILLQSDDFFTTLSHLRTAKMRCLLMGHADLHVLPWEGAAPYVREASTLFYERTILDNGINREGRGEEKEKEEKEKENVMGVFEQRGPVETINVAQPADSFYHDPTAAYTEGHAVFTEELRLKRRLR